MNKNKKERSCRLFVLTFRQNTEEKIKDSEKINKFFDLAKKKKMEYEGEGNTICCWCVWKSSKGLGKGLEE